MQGCLNAARAKKFTADIEKMNIDDEDEAVNLQAVIDEGSWSEVPWSGGMKCDFKNHW